LKGPYIMNHKKIVATPSPEEADKQKITQLKQQNQALTAATEKAANKLQQLLTRDTQLTAKLTRRNAEITELKRQQTENAPQKLAEAIAPLQKALSAAQVRYTETTTALAAEKKALTTQIAQLQHEQTKLQDATTHYQQQVSTVTATHQESLRTEIAALAESLKPLIAHTQQHPTAQPSDALSRLTSLQDQVERLAEIPATPMAPKPRTAFQSTPKGQHPLATSQFATSPESDEDRTTPTGEVDTDAAAARQKTLQEQIDAAANEGKKTGDTTLDAANKQIQDTAAGDAELKELGI
jgi:hypothetical protein